MVKRYIELYLAARRALSPEYGEQAGNVARQLLSAASGKSAEAIIADCDIYASEEIEAKLDKLMSRALSGEPVAYILGQWDFMGMTLTVTRDTLIPRDDTMAVTELAIDTALHLHEEPRIRRHASSTCAPARAASAWRSPSGCAMPAWCWATCRRLRCAWQRRTRRTCIF